MHNWSKPLFSSAADTHKELPRIFAERVQDGAGVWVLKGDVHSQSNRRNKVRSLLQEWYVSITPASLSSHGPSIMSKFWWYKSHNFVITPQKCYTVFKLVHSAAYLHINNVIFTMWLFADADILLQSAL